MTRPSTTIITLRHLLLAAAALGCAIPASQALSSPADWFSGEKVQGSTIVKRQTRELGHFTGVALNLPAKVELRIGNSESVTIETDDNLLPLVETVIEDGTLKLRPNKRNLNLQTRSMKIVVQARSVERLSIGGSGSIQSDVLRGDKLRFDVGGSGSIFLKGIEGDNAIISVGGSGSLSSGAGSLNKASIAIGGSGDVDIGKLKATSASVSVAGSGEATLWATDSLSVSIAGSGDVKYYGDPKISKSVAGSGSTQRLGDSPQR